MSIPTAVKVRLSIGALEAGDVGDKTGCASLTGFVLTGFASVRIGKGSWAAGAGGIFVCDCTVGGEGTFISDC